MNSLKNLSDKRLIEAYKKAIELSLSESFLNLLKAEIKRRRLNI